MRSRDAVEHQDESANRSPRQPLEPVRAGLAPRGRRGAAARGESAWRTNRTRVSDTRRTQDGDPEGDGELAEETSDHIAMRAAEMSTAISEMVSETMVKPTCLEPLSAARSGE